MKKETKKKYLLNLNFKGSSAPTHAGYSPSPSISGLLETGLFMGTIKIRPHNPRFLVSLSHFNFITFFLGQEGK